MEPGQEPAHIHRFPTLSEGEDPTCRLPNVENTRTNKLPCLRFPIGSPGLRLLSLHSVRGRVIRACRVVGVCPCDLRAPSASQVINFFA